MAHKAYGLNELREMFLTFFESKGHLRLPSFPLIPQNDASLLLINSGMAPMKPFFTGEVEPPRRRVCTCQKCIRTGDIENIGKTARHGTYFEMLGNFSFGDYFKEEAIAFSWEFLTSPQWVGLEPERLYPSIFENDEEAFTIWNQKIGIPAEKIFRFGKKDNFWEHGSGPCGPCSEIYYDRGEEWGCGRPDCTVGCECDRYIEVWNNVFSQFENDGEGHYTELAQKNIDTGMGLERLACVCQNVASLFDVDTVMSITNRVTALTGASYGQSAKMDVSLRVITDHIRSSVMMICDGVLPSNEGRGYVLRRLLRRAARHGKLLGVNAPFLFEVVATVVQENQGQYPDLREKEAYITKVIRTEEESFAKTIDAGMRIFDQMRAEHSAKGESRFSGSDAFKLYDTYGFPIDLTIEMLEEQSMTVDLDGFRRLMEEQRVRARKAREALGDLAWAGIDLGLDNTPTAFTGYETLEGEHRILAIVSEGELSGSMQDGAEGILVLDATPFYAEMGGQVADHGTITLGDACFTVRDVQKDKGGKYLHHGQLTGGSLAVGDRVRCTVDSARRGAIMRAHSATHLLQSALEQVLGDHVHQAGSLVEPDRLRFDFTHFSAISAEEMAKINAILTENILSGIGIETLVLPIEEAKKLGATALFGEKYGDTVRVVKMGDVSLEFCGGTHLDNTAKVGLLRIVSESSVASGVRRIEAVTGRAVLEQLEGYLALIEQTADVLKCSNPNDLTRRARQTMDELKEAKRSIEQYKAKESAGGAASLLQSAVEIGGLKLVTAQLAEGDANSLRQFGDVLRDKEPAIVAVLALVSEGKVTLQAVCGKAAVACGVKAGDLIKAIAPICGGRGGGKPDSAMGGGSEVGKVAEALAEAEAFVRAKL